MRRLGLIFGGMLALAAASPASAAFQECRAPAADGLSTLIYSHGARSCQAGKVMICKDGNWEPVEGERCQ